MSDSPLTWHGRPILTPALAATRYGISIAAMSRALRRPPLDAVRRLRIPGLGRVEVCDQAELDAAWAARPGRGANLRGHR